MRLLTKLICFVFLAATPLLAKADTLDDFTFTVGGQTVSWLLPPNPTPDISSPHFAIFNDVPVVLNGVPETATYIEFASSLIGGGVAVDIGAESPYLFGIGSQAFTGPTTSPVFLLSPNPIDLTSYGDPATLTITPEPSTFLLLGSGFVGLAGAGRRRFFRGVF